MHHLVCVIDLMRKAPLAWTAFWAAVPLMILGIHDGARSFDITLAVTVTRSLIHSIADILLSHSLTLTRSLTYCHSLALMC